MEAQHRDAIMDCATNFHGTRLATCAAKASHSESGRTRRDDPSSDGSSPPRPCVRAARAR